MSRHDDDDRGVRAREIARRPGRSHPPSLVRLAERLLRDERLVERGDVVLCACSGGPDSTALLSVLARLRERFGFTLAAHGVDHGLRESAREELACAERVARALGVPFATTSVRVAPGGNLQARAREARRGALRAAARLAGARLLATGHTADDRAETFLLRLLRGAGPRGLAVLPPSAPLPDDDSDDDDGGRGGDGDARDPRGGDVKGGAGERGGRGGSGGRGGQRGLAGGGEGRARWRSAESRSAVGRPSGITLIRPLLLARRVDVEAHLVRHGLVVGRDPSNEDARFLRVRVRRELLPLMEAMAPGVAAHLCAVAEMLADPGIFEADVGGLGELGRAQRIAVARAKKCEQPVNLLLSGGREVMVGFADGKAVLMKEARSRGARRASSRSTPGEPRAPGDDSRFPSGDRSRATSPDDTSEESD